MLSTILHTSSRCLFRAVSQVTKRKLSLFAVKSFLQGHTMVEQDGKEEHAIWCSKLLLLEAPTGSHLRSGWEGRNEPSNSTSSLLVQTKHFIDISQK